MSDINANDLRIQYDESMPRHARIKVIGVGGGGNNAVNRVDASEAKAGSVFTVWVRIPASLAASMPGTWSVTSVQATACSGAAVAIGYPNPVVQVAP